MALPIYLLGTLYKEISGSRLLGLFGLIAGTAMLVATQSKTSVGAIVFGFAVLLPARYLFRRNPSLRVSSQLLFLLGLLCAVAVILNWGPGELLNSLIGDPTLTGRDQIWLYVTQKFNASPILGVGYGAVWQVGPEIEAALKRAGLVFVFNEAHNGYLDIAAQLGVTWCRLPGDIFDSNPAQQSFLLGHNREKRLSWSRCAHNLRFLGAGSIQHHGVALLPARHRKFRHTDFSGWICSKPQ